MINLITPYPPYPQPGEHERLREEAVSRIGFPPSDPWGHLWVRESKAYVLVPWSTSEELAEPAIAFLDESYDRDSKTLLYGGLVFLPFPIMIAVARFIENLLVLCDVHPGIWPGDVPPPRLHLRELHPYAAREKTLWRHVSKTHLDLLIKAIVSTGISNSAVQFVFPVSQSHLERAIHSNASDLCGPESVPDLTIQAAAIQLLIASTHTLRGAAPIRLVMDHDSTPVRVGRRRRQKTLRFLDALISCGNETLADHGLVFDHSARHSSQFPSDFSLGTLRDTGYPVRRLLSPIGLQLADLFVGLWRQITLHHGSPFGLTASDLGNPIVQRIDWLDKRPSDLS